MRVVIIMNNMCVTVFIMLFLWVIIISGDVGCSMCRGIGNGNWERDEKKNQRDGWMRFKDAGTPVLYSTVHYRYVSYP